MSSIITHEPGGTAAAGVTSTIARPSAPSGWRHGAAWTYGVMLAASAVALFVSFILSAETLQLARHPRQSLSRDINAVLSCSAAAGSWRSEIVKLGTLSVPKAFIGIAAESVLVTLAVLGMIRVSVPRWFTVCTWLGGLAALAYGLLAVQPVHVRHSGVVSVVPCAYVLHDRPVHGVVARDRHRPPRSRP